VIGSDQDIARKLSEATRGLIALNGAAVAGVIGLIQSYNSIPLLIRISGGIFLLGILSSIASWAVGEPFGHPNETQVERAMKLTAIYIWIGFICFFLGALTAFVAVNIPSKA
jgi:hypothetical protein